MAPTPFTKSCSLRDRDLRPRAKDKDGRKDLNLNLNLKPRLAVNFKRAFQMVFWATPNYLTPGWPLKSASEADKLARSHIPYTISYPISHSSYPICTHTYTHTRAVAGRLWFSKRIVSRKPPENAARDWGWATYVGTIWFIRRMVYKGLSCMGVCVCVRVFCASINLICVRVRVRVRKWNSTWV